MDNKEQKPEITTDDIVAYITNHQTEDKKSPVLSKKKLDDKTEEMVLDKNIADDYIKTLKLYDNKLSDEELKDDEVENKNPRIHIPADQIIIDKAKTNTLPKQLDKVTITDDEKDIYIRNTLLDMPISLDIKYGKINTIFTFTSKLVQTQEYLSRYLKEILLSDKAKVMGTEEMYNIIFRANVSVILNQINGKNAFDDGNNEKINSRDLTYDEFKQIIEERAKLLSKKSQQLWSMIINAACVFERKEQLLAEYFINEDF